MAPAEDPKPPSLLEEKDEFDAWKKIFDMKFNILCNLVETTSNKTSHSTSVEVEPHRRQKKTKNQSLEQEPMNPFFNNSLDPVQKES